MIKSSQTVGGSCTAVWYVELCDFTDKYPNKKSPVICSFLHHMWHATGVHIASSHPLSAPEQHSPGKMKKLSNPLTSSLDIDPSPQAHTSLRTSDPESLFQTDKFRVETHRGCLVYSVVC